jgi:hypothetical protein
MRSQFLDRIVLAFFFAVGLSAVGLAAEAAEPMPPPGKADSFAQDTWLRRNKYPLRIEVSDLDGKERTNLPVTLSVACGKGDYAAGKLCPTLDDKPLAAQVNVLATWPKDGSIKHALVTVVIAKIAAGQTLTVGFAAQAAPAPGKYQAAADLKKFTARCEFESKDGHKTTSAIDAAVLVKMAAALNGTLPADDLNKLAPRLAGPLCYEFETMTPAKTDGAPDASIDVYYRLRVYSGQKGVRVEYETAVSGYTAEANAFTSAALARYDNPRAQKMYEIARAIIEKNAKRVPGLDYVK